MESIFERISCAPPTLLAGKRKSAVIDHGNPANWYGRKAEKCVACETDDEVVKGVQEVLALPNAGPTPAGSDEGGYNFVFARLTELADGLGCGKLSSFHFDHNADFIRYRDHTKNAKQ
jgi:RNA exonuclease 1